MTVDEALAELKLNVPPKLMTTSEKDELEEAIIQMAEKLVQSQVYTQAIKQAALISPILGVAIVAHSTVVHIIHGAMFEAGRRFGRSELIEEIGLGVKKESSDVDL